MLYLAEVQRKKGVIGSGKPELRLLACQRGENSWSAVPGEEVISAPDDVAYAAGVLVMAEVGGNRQVQRINEAGRQLVSILQGFTRMQDKFKTQEEEIEQWKQSLTYQSQELNRRELDMEAREEQLQQMEEDFEKLEQQRQEVETHKEEVDNLRQEYDRKSQELEGAWAQLRGEMAKLEEMQADASRAVGLDEDKARQMQELLDRLSGAIAPTEAVRDQLNHSFEILGQHQSTVETQHRTIEEQRAQAQQHEESLNQQIQDIQARWQEWKQAQAALEQAKAELQSRQQALDLKQTYIDRLTQQVKQQDELYKQFCQLVESSDSFSIGGKVDIAALENMSLEDLETTVRDMEKDLEKMSGYVGSQEEELKAQQEAIDALQQQIQNTSEYERLQLESEMADEQDRYRMLDETLVGQRRNLQERREVLKQHQAVLARRQGISTGDSLEPAIDLSPVINQLEALKQDLLQTIQAVQAEVRELQSSADQARASVEQQAGEQEARWQAIQQQEQELQRQKAAAGELWGRVNVYQDVMQMVHGSVDGLKEKLEAISGVMSEFQEASDYQLQAIAEMRQMIAVLTQSQTPEYVAS
ncbi:pilus motility taxis protein HmpF [Leptolyngbya sp. AN02str]|uniref:pilus motility taxis protein HmpF n=1 Tax=Leptolyngbya sp. AN02str TaxID=3423363 RepID=UPI003D319F73